MKTLYLVRHAKSSWKFPDLDDFDRPLNRRGKRDAPMMGKRLQQRSILPDLIVSSPAKRAQKIARAIAKAVAYPASAVAYSPEVYEASVDGLIALLQAVDDQVAVLMLVGHNPELTDLANRLAAHYIDNVVTSGVVAIEFSAARWAEVGRSSKGRFLWYDYPKSTQQ
ncbi:MAG: histidine phosphatase family protein [Tunicatimonas sp.]